MPIRVFGDFERGRNGKPTGEYPGWYYQNRPQVEDLRDSVRQKERALEEGFVHPAKRGEFKEQLAKEKERLSRIDESIPKPSAEQKDRLWRLRKQLGNDIADAMYTRTDMNLGLADAHGEAERMKEKKMPLSGEDEAHLAKEMGIRVSDDGKVSRTDKERMYKITSRALGESTNTEVLRKDRVSKYEELSKIQKAQRGRPGRPPAKSKEG